MEDLNAVGFGTLTAQTHQDVNGMGCMDKWPVGCYHVHRSRYRQRTKMMFSLHRANQHSLIWQCGMERMAIEMALNLSA